MELDNLVALTNIAKDLPQEKLDTIAKNAIKGFNKDLQSCEDHFNQLAD